MTTVNYRAGDEIFAPGSGSGTIHHIASGHVRLYKVLHDGRSINLAMLGPGEFFTQDTQEDGYATGCIAEAMSDATIELIERSAFEESIGANHSAAIEMIDSQRRQIASLHTLIEHLLARDTSVRLATTLLQLADGFGKEREDGRVAIGVPVTHQSLANMIGSNRVTVTRKMLELQQTQAIASQGRNQLTVNTEKLRKISARDS